MLLPTFRRLPAVLALLAAAACTPQLAYQVLETRPATEAAAAPLANADLAVAFDFWNDGAQLVCTVRNLTDRPLYVDLNRTQLVVNGLAQDYFADEQTTATATRSSSVATAYFRPFEAYARPGAVGAASSNSRSVRPKAVLQVPPRAAVVVGSPCAVPARLLHCDLRKWKLNQPATVAFTEAASPLHLRQFLTYSLRPDGQEPRTLDHAFWVERVSNMSPASFRGPLVRDESCGKKLASSHGSFPYAKAGNLYVTFRPPAAF